MLKAVELMMEEIGMMEARLGDSHLPDKLKRMATGPYMKWLPQYQELKMGEDKREGPASQPQSTLSRI